MSPLSCSFCCHTNPEHSKFCNECGSPLNLVPCSLCEAINNVADSRCCRCGARLDPAATVEHADKPQHTSAAWETDDGTGTGSIGMERRAIASASIPISLADRLASSTWSAHAARHDAPRPVVPHARAAGELTPQDNPEPDRTPSTYRGVSRDYAARTGYRIHAVVLALLFVAVAGAVYWSSIQPTQPAERTTGADPAPASVLAPVAVAPPAVAPASEGTARDRAIEVPAAQSDAATASTDPTRASTAQPQGDVTPTGARTVAEPAPGTPPAINGHASTDARRTVPHVRTREEAELDARATQRLIARDLGTAPRVDSPAAPASGP
jgi:hypothetical protein